MKLKLSNKKKLIHRIFRIVFALVISFAILQVGFEYFEAFTYDFRVKLRPQPPKSGYITTIAVDLDTVETLKRDPTARDHIKLLKVLAKYNPRAVVYTMNMNSLVGSYDEIAAFAKETKKLPVYIAINDVAIKGLEKTLLLEPPLNDLNVHIAPITVDKVSFAKDNVTRRIILTYQNQKSLHFILANDINRATSASDYQGVFNYLDTEQNLINYHPRGSYQPLKFMNVMSDQVLPNQITGKIVIIDRDNMVSTDDYVRTPYSNEATAMSRLELHANIFDTLILNQSPIKAPRSLDILLTCVISILTVFVVLTLSPMQGIFILMSTLASFILVSFGAFVLFDFIIEMAHPLLAIFVCYYFFIPYRLIIENRRSWEYYQRNKLLTQVEELKSNFLRMMSHDLKTPLARIQGMADIVLKDSQQMTDKQLTAVESIGESAEELSEFIGSILNLGRIESKEIKLQLKSKDINTLLTETIKKCEFLARKKNITVITEFEPMFSLKIDEDLMRQVFTNLIENAIKYSPENSKILVTTEEKGGNVVTQVADQGMGIPEPEVENIFTKFYRSNKVKNTDIKGSGLGLYLAKYFVELHKGKISVESEFQQGSTFTVELPMEGA